MSPRLVQPSVCRCPGLRRCKSSGALGEGGGLSAWAPRPMLAQGASPERTTSHARSRMVFRRKTQQKKHSSGTKQQPTVTKPTAAHPGIVSERSIKRFSLSLWRSAEHHCSTGILPQRNVPVGNPLPIEDLITLCEVIVELAHKYGTTSPSHTRAPASSHDTATEHDTENPQQDIPWWEDWSECDYLSI